MATGGKKAEKNVSPSAVDMNPSHSIFEIHRAGIPERRMYVYVWDIWGGLLQERPRKERPRKTSISMVGAGSRNWTTSWEGLRGMWRCRAVRPSPSAAPSLIPQGPCVPHQEFGSDPPMQPLKASRPPPALVPSQGTGPACDYRMTLGSGPQAFVKSAESSREDLPKVGLMSLMASREFERKKTTLGSFPREVDPETKM